MSNETTFEFAPQGEFTVTAAASFTYKPNYTITFSNETGVVGKLDFNGPALVFTGDVDESAKLFVDAVGKWFAGRMQWVGLTDAEIWEWVKENTALTEESGIRIVRAIEAKLKEKNGG